MCAQLGAGFVVARMAGGRKVWMRRDFRQGCRTIRSKDGVFVERAYVPTGPFQAWQPVPCLALAYAEPARSFGCRCRLQPQR